MRLDGDPDGFHGGGRRRRLEVERDEREQRARFAGRRGQRDAADVAAAAVEVEREHNFPGRHPAQIEPLGQPLEHRAHHEAHRLKAVHAPFEFDRFGEAFRGRARDQRRAAFAARDPYQLNRARAEPTADRAYIQLRQLAQPPDSPARKRLLQFRTAAARLVVEPEQVERQPTQELRLAARRDHPRAAASRRQQRNLLA